ncbi:hypothetical protein R83H12_00442 [Fibrobacteria bacterium R8-3-H12]
MMLEDILREIGITGGTSGFLFFVLNKIMKNKIEELNDKNKQIADLQNEATQHRKEERDFRMNAQDKRIEKLEHALDEFPKIYQRINQISDMLSEIKGYLRYQNDKSK